MPWARASALARHLACPAASHLPRYDRGKWTPGYLHGDKSFDVPLVEVVERSMDAANWGTAMHAAKAGEPSLPVCEELMAPHRERLWPAQLGVHEMTVSYDCETGEVDTFISPVEAERTSWKEARPEECVVGTCDWWAALPAGEPWVDDLKTGWKKPNPTDPQMLFYLMCRMKREPGALTGRISITHWPRRKDRPTRDGLWRKVPLSHLQDFEDDLVEAWRMTRAKSFAVPGTHCQYCPSVEVCEKANK